MIRSLTRFSTTATTSSAPLNYDIVVVGGGTIGTTLTSLLSRTFTEKGIPLTVALLDNQPLPKFEDDVVNNGPPTIRTYALSPSSQGVISDSLAPLSSSSSSSSSPPSCPFSGRKGTYTNMQVWESNGPSLIRFSSSDSPNKTTQSSETELGALIEDSHILELLHKRTLKHNAPNVTLLNSSSLQSINVTNDNAEVIYSDTSIATSTEQRKPNTKITASLVIACDGSNSQVRSKVGTFKPISKSYGINALICTVKASSSSSIPTAFQRFSKDGPIALLPLWGGYYSVVYSCPPAEATRLMGLDEGLFIGEVNDLLRHGPSQSATLCSPDYKNSLPPPLQSVISTIDGLAKLATEGLSLAGMNELGVNGQFELPPLLTSVTSKRFSLPLTLLQCSTYISPRITLCGDSAHSIHPFAGQGLNLGLADVRSLVNNIVKNIESGSDVSDDYHLSLYDIERRREVSKMMVGLEGLHHLFRAGAAPVIWGRGVGMSLVNFNIGGVKSLFVKNAMGGQ